MDPSTAYVLESRLISMDGATQIPISEFEAAACWPNTSSRQIIATAHT